MRLKNLIIGDIKFQIKYGFYFIYIIMTIVYLFILYILPVSWKSMASYITIFSDPAALGLFFMGAIVLFEKSQRVIHSLAVSPIKVSEYILSKMISLCFITVFVAVMLGIFSNIQNPLMVMIGTIMSSLIFTLLGLIAASYIQSLNQFILVTVPIEIICFVPTISFLCFPQFTFLKFYPMSMCIQMIMGSYENIVLNFVVIIITICLLYSFALHATTKMWKEIGGIHL